MLTKSAQAHAGLTQKLSSFLLFQHSKKCWDQGSKPSLVSRFWRALCRLHFGVLFSSPIGHVAATSLALRNSGKWLILGHYQDAHNCRQGSGHQSPHHIGYFVACRRAGRCHGANRQVQEGEEKGQGTATRGPERKTSGGSWTADTTLAPVGCAMICKHSKGLTLGDASAEPVPHQCKAWKEWFSVSVCLLYWFSTPETAPSSLSWMNGKRMGQTLLSSPPMSYLCSFHHSCIQKGRKRDSWLESQ